jgi:hypothetical protein
MLPVVLLEFVLLLPPPAARLPPAPAVPSVLSFRGCRSPLLVRGAEPFLAAFFESGASAVPPPGPEPAPVCAITEAAAPHAIATSARATNRWGTNDAEFMRACSSGSVPTARRGLPREPVQQATFRHP